MAAPSVPGPRPGDLILACEVCANLLHVRGDEAGKLLPCPLCGCLNQAPDTELEAGPDTLGEGPLVRGRMEVTGPVVQASLAQVESGAMSLPDLPEPVQEALVWLQEHGWQFRFVLERRGEEEEEGEEE